MLLKGFSALDMAVFSFVCDVRPVSAARQTASVWFSWQSCLMHGVAGVFCECVCTRGIVECTAVVYLSLVYRMAA